MITHEKEGTFTVSFDRMADGHIVGRIEGEDTPVYVHKDSLPASLGETWTCRLFENSGPGGVNYFAILLDRLEDEAVEEPKDKQAVEEFTINEDVDVDDYDPVLADGRRMKWRRIFRYIGEDTLYSDLLDDRPFIAYSSPDRQLIQLIPCDWGDLFCNDGMIRIAGLDSLANGEKGLLIPYSTDKGTFILHFR